MNNSKHTVPNYLLNDVSRCSNHRCLLRMNCQRYMQIGYDTINNVVAPVNHFTPKGEGYRASKWNCEHQLKITEKHNTFN